MNAKPICYEVDPFPNPQTTLCGIRHPLKAFTQDKRVMSDFIAFLVVKGEIDLTDFMPAGPEQIRVKSGEIHIVAPGIFQASTVPFAPGIKFLWFHFSFGKKYSIRDQRQTSERIENFYQPGIEASPQSRWFIPRHLDVNDRLETFIELHTKLLENVRLWGINDQGTQIVGAHMVYELHRLFLTQSLHATDRGNQRPEQHYVSLAKNFIRVHFEKNISLNDVAKAISLSPSYLSRCFHAHTGLTMSDFILRTKIESAKRLFCETPRISVKEVAFRTGFGSAAYFCRIFHRYERKSPSHFALKAKDKDRI